MADTNENEFRDHYIKLERVGAYIRKTEEKLKVYDKQLLQIRKEKQKKETSILTQLGSNKRLNKTI